MFEDRIGRVEGMKANLTFKEEPKPVFCKARTIPFVIRPKVEEELDNLARRNGNCFQSEHK